MEWLDNRQISARQPLWEALQGGLGYRFRNGWLLASAMCHSSFANEHPDLQLGHNERLEFLGDAVLDLVVSEQLLRDFGEFREGELTRLRAEVVAEASLADLARQLGIGDCLLLGRGERQSGGQHKASVLADALEALFGAMFQDAGFDRTADVIAPLFTPRLRQAAARSGQDCKTRLQELLQARFKSLPVYRLLDAAGPDHCRHFRVDVLIADRVLGSGTGPSKKRAEQEAARAALARLADD
ncbi:MAG: ribonuclease III [Desulfuromonadales bacterium]|nr:ribonuclease III [Desulfuromonadales bacterium]